MTRESSETRQPVPEEDSGPPRPHTHSLAELMERSEAMDNAPGSTDEHIGATEEQVSDTPAPAGEEFDDEPRQG